MYIAMNRFRIGVGSEEAFEQMWKTRESRLDNVPGFIEFHLLRGKTTDTYTLFATHTIWTSEAAFIAWTESESFKQSHARGGGNASINYISRPEFEGFETVI